MQIFTIGYEGLNQEQLLKLLKWFEVSVVADVREKPISRKPGFSKNALSKYLANNEIKYMGFPELGSSKETRNALRSSGDYISFIKSFENSLDEKQVKIDAIYDMIKRGERVALFCFEREADKCHRKIIANRLKSKNGNDLVVTHIKRIV